MAIKILIMKNNQERTKPALDMTHESSVIYV